MELAPQHVIGAHAEQVLLQPEHEKHHGVVAHAHAGGAALDGVQRLPGDARALGHLHRAEATAQTGEADVGSQLSKDAGKGGEHGECLLWFTKARNSG